MSTVLASVLFGAIGGVVGGLLAYYVIGPLVCRWLDHIEGDAK